ncbi:MAG: polysaccharide biosynthesis C-terminal domain-containing protein [Bacteroidia bacterium]|nr:polysaccharide biosynthesis C-terminal domain-containing protein [Bacteroidia bacterium]
MSFKRNIGNTLISKVITAFFSLGTSVLLSRYLGREAMGDIALVVMGVSISLIVSGVWSGPVLTYYASRKPLWQLLLPAYISGFICALIIPPLLAGFDLLPANLVYATMLISVCQNAHGMHLSYLLGVEKVKAHNTSALLQVMIVFCGFALYIFSGGRDLHVYLGLVAFSFLISALIAARHLKKTYESDQGYLSIAMETARYSLAMQTGTLFQFFNYRLSYYFINSWLGTSTLGVFSLAMQITEGVLLLSRSIATVLFSRVSASEDPAEKMHKTLISFKIAIISTLIFLGGLLLMPAQLFTFLFGEEFGNLKSVFFHISPGIVFLAGLNVLSSFFSGDYKAYVNMYGSLAGLIVIGIAGWFLIGWQGIYGAAWANSLSYFTGLAVAVFYLKRFYGIHVADLFPQRKDLDKLQQFSRFLKR